LDALTTKPLGPYGTGTAHKQHCVEASAKFQMILFNCWNVGCVSSMQT